MADSPNAALILKLQIQSSFMQEEGGAPTHSQKPPAHEEIKSIALQAIEFQSGTEVAGNKI